MATAVWGGIDGRRVSGGCRCVGGRGGGVNGTLNRLSSEKVSDLSGQQSDFGHEGLAGVVTDFCARWELGVENLAKDGQGIADQLSRSVQAYLQVDRSLKGYLDGILACPSGPDPGVS